MQGALAAAADETRKDIIPERYAAVGVDHRHAFVERSDDLEAALFVFDANHVRAVVAAREIQRNGGERQHVPHPVFDEGREPHRQARAHDEVG